MMIKDRILLQFEGFEGNPAFDPVIMIPSFLNTGMRIWISNYLKI